MIDLVKRFLPQGDAKSDDVQGLQVPVKVEASTADSSESEPEANSFFQAMGLATKTHPKKKAKVERDISKFPAPAPTASSASAISPLAPKQPQEPHEEGDLPDDSPDATLARKRGRPRATINISSLAGIADS